MTIKFDAVNGEALTAPGDPSFNLLTSWAIGFVISIDTTATGNTEQMILANGAHWSVAYTGSAHAAPNTVVFNPRDGSGNFPAFYNILQAGAKFLFVLQHTGNTVEWNWCPILTNDPVDGSAVTSYTPGNIYGTYGGVGPFSIGKPVSGNPGVALDQSLGRVFKIAGTLTKLEIAKLAYGKTISQIGKSPDIAIRMDDANDITDTGPTANVFTKVGTLTQGTDPGFGFGAAITAPVFTTAPAISGNPRVGTARDYTPGTVTTNEAPTVTCQWTISTTLGGAQTDIAGATGPAGTTYTPVAGDVGKYLRVREKAVNSAAPAPTGVTSTSDPVQVLAAAGSTTRTLSLAMKSDANTLAANRTGLKVGVYTGTGPDNLGTTLYQLAGKTTDASGILNVSFDAPAVSVGQTVLLMVFGANGDHYIGLRTVA